LEVAGNIKVGASGADAVRHLRIDGTNGSSEIAGFILENDGANAKVNFKYNIGNGTPATKLTIDHSGNLTGTGTLGTSASRWSTIYGVAGSYSGQVTAATLKATGAAIVSDTSTDGRGVYRDNTSYDLRLGGGTDSTDGAYISLSGAARGGSSSAYNGRVEYHAGGGVGSGQSGVLGDHVWYADNSSGSTVLMTLDSSTSNLTVGGHTNAQSSSTISASSKIDSADITTGAFRFYSTAGFRGGLGTGRWASGVTGTEVDLTLYVAGDNDFNIWTNNTNLDRDWET
jgi:hypothetical protein